MNKLLPEWPVNLCGNCREITKSNICSISGVKRDPNKEFCSFIDFVDNGFRQPAMPSIASDPVEDKKLSEECKLYVKWIESECVGPMPSMSVKWSFNNK